MKYKFIKLPNKDGCEVIRIVSGDMIEKIDIDYSIPDLAELQKLASYAIAHVLEHDKSYTKFTNKKMKLYRGGHHLNLVEDGNLDDLKLFYIGDDRIIPEENLDKDIYINC